MSQLDDVTCECCDVYFEGEYFPFIMCPDCGDVSCIDCRGEFMHEHKCAIAQVSYMALTRGVWTTSCALWEQLNNAVRNALCY